MKKQDLTFILLSVLLFAPFFLSNTLYDIYNNINLNHPYFMAFVKFALLATYGEVLGLRVKTGAFNLKGFGVFPKMIVWGFLGMWIAIAMKTFAIGAPFMAQTLGLKGIVPAMIEPFSKEKILGAFIISIMMNTCFAPVFMTLHKITDTHILQYNGSMLALIRPLNIGKILATLNWSVQWNFVFKKTIPFFWIPAHTITFLLPAQYQVLFAAALSIVLGLILSIAALMQRS